MSFANALHDDQAVEACLDQLGEALLKLDAYPPTVLAVALRVHLEALLQALLESRLCTHAEVRAYLRELEHEVMQHERE